MTHRARLAIAAILLFVIGGAVLTVCVHRDTAPDAPVPSVLFADDGDLRYAYHVLSGDEGLFDRAADPKLLKNLGKERPADLKRLHDDLEKKVKAKYDVESLDDLSRRQDVMDRLRGHPYF